MTYYGDYRFIFGCGKQGEFLFLPGVHERNLYDALFEARGSFLYVYDEYSNLVGLIPNSDPLCKQITAHLAKKHGFNYLDIPSHTGVLFSLLSNLRSEPYSFYYEALEYAARILVTRAQKLVKENARYDRVLSVGPGRE